MSMTNFILFGLFVAGFFALRAILNPETIEQIVRPTRSGNLNQRQYISLLCCNVILVTALWSVAPAFFITLGYSIMAFLPESVRTVATNILPDRALSGLCLIGLFVYLGLVRVIFRDISVDLGRILRARE